MSDDQEVLAAKVKAELASLYVNQKHVLYHTTDNPVHAWGAYLFARHAEIPIPDWVLAYLDDCAGALSGPDSPRSKKAIADALGLGKKGGRSVTAQAPIEQRNQSLVDQIEVLRQRDPRRIAAMVEQLGDTDRAKKLRQQEPSKVDDIIAVVADEHGLSYDRVRDIYYSFPRHLR